MKLPNRGNTGRQCSCGKPGTVCMIDPEYPRQRMATERWYFCLDCSRLCRYLVPDSQVPTQQSIDAEHMAAWRQKEKE